ncbi:MAG: GDP-mannose 6-dehydrogenase, partial [Pseudonocardiales bacterium]|nr:GDP-mannose 6-dehydrogenase [Pseudonocardiales bacterium]
MKVSVFGLGYVGVVSAACLAAQGHEVVGVDVNPTKVDLVNRGQSTVVEERIRELTQEVVEKGALRATTDVAEAIGDTDLSLICVGTPSAPNGSLSTVYLERVAEEIGAAIGAKESRHTVVFRSTMLPGTCERLLVPALEKASGKQAGADFGVAVNPEFLRESTSVKDYYDPPKTVVGEFDAASGDPVVELYADLPGP